MFRCLIGKPVRYLCANYGKGLDMIDSPRAFRAKVESMIRKANPDAVSLTIKWERCNRCTFPGSGDKGFAGTVLISADGYRPTRKVVTSDSQGVSA